MDKSAGLSYEIQYTKAADKFLKTHEDVREQYEDAIKQLLVGEHPEKVDVKRIRENGMIITGSSLGATGLCMPSSMEKS